MTSSVQVPLITALWRQNSPPRMRGRLFSGTVVVGSLSAVAVSGAVSGWLWWQPTGFGVPLVLSGVAMLALSAVVLRTPSEPLAGSAANARGSHLSQLILLPVRDRLFGWICLTWYLLGFGNLVTLPLRAEFAAGERGLALAAGTAILVVAVLPEAAALLATMVWGRLFDRVNFIALRMAINVFFILSAIITFTGGLTGLVVGSILFGIGKGGGSVAWSLWVTKFAPPERTADYMAVHTFLTGTRGILGAGVAFAAIGSMGVSIASVGWFGATLMTLATLMLIPVLSKPGVAQFVNCFLQWGRVQICRLLKYTS